MKRYVLAITGATGPVIGIRVLKELASSAEVHLIISEQSFAIIAEETGLLWHAADAEGIQAKIRQYTGTEKVYYYDALNFYAPVASGSFKTDGMLVVPCSMKSLAGISHGYSNSLIERAADVTIKEGRPLLLCPRETPLSPIHLENMLSLSRLGVKIVPPVPGFYHQPKTLDDMIDFLAGKVLDVMGIEHSLFRRWGS